MLKEQKFGYFPRIQPLPGTELRFSPSQGECADQSATIATIFHLPGNVGICRYDKKKHQSHNSCTNYDYQNCKTQNSYESIQWIYLLHYTMYFSHFVLRYIILYSANPCVNKVKRLTSFFVTVYICKHQPVFACSSQFSNTAGVVYTRVGRCCV